MASVRSFDFANSSMKIIQGTNISVKKIKIEFSGVCIFLEYAKKTEVKSRPCKKNEHELLALTRENVIVAVIQQRERRKHSS